MKKGDLAKFIKEAVRWRVFDRTVAETKARNTKAPVIEIEAASVRRSRTMGAARVTNVAVVCAANTYSAGGTVSDLAGAVVLQNNGSDSLVIGSNGAFTFTPPVAQGGTYSVTVQTQPATQTVAPNDFLRMPRYRFVPFTHDGMHIDAI